MDSRGASISRSVTERRPSRPSRKLARSTSEFSPLAKQLLRSLHEQKKADLAAKRAHRLQRSQWLVVPEESLEEVDLSEYEMRSHKQEQKRTKRRLSAWDESSVRQQRNDNVWKESSFTSRGCDVTAQSDDDKFNMKPFKDIMKQFSKMITKLFPRKRSKKLDVSVLDFVEVMSYSVVQSTVL